MYALLQIIAATVLLLITQELLRRANRWVIWGIFILLPILLTPYLIQVNELGLFSWFKFYTVFLTASWGAALRFTSLGKLSWARFTIPLVLAINIVEATVVDLTGANLAHTLNAAAGLLLIATMPYGSEATRIESAKKHHDLLYGANKSWVIGYTLWNWTFVYLNYPSLTGHHTAVLAAGLVIALIDPRRWSQTRASTLGVNLLLTASAFKSMIAWLDTTVWYDEQLAIVAAGLAFLFMFIHFMTSTIAQTCLSKISQLGLHFPQTKSSGRMAMST